MTCTSSASTMTFTIEGDVNVSITLSEIDGAIQFDVAVLSDTGSIGDLNALFFDLYDDTLLNGLSIEGSDITDTNLRADSVTKVDSYTNMNGEVIKELGKFDGGIQFGTSGMAQDDIRSTSFTISHDTVDLSLSDFALQDFGVRLTSVGSEDGLREDSLKLGGTAPEVPEGPTGSSETAINDIMTVDENANFGRGDTFDFLDSGESSILANDLGDCDAPYTGLVTSMNGVTVDPNADQTTPVFVQGSNGGTLMITADGSINFSADNLGGSGNPFAGLNDGESASTFFEYTLEGGSTVTLEVVVNGIGTGGGGGGGEMDLMI